MKGFPEESEIASIWYKLRPLVGIGEKEHVAPITDEIANKIQPHLDAIARIIRRQEPLA